MSEPKVGAARLFYLAPPGVTPEFKLVSWDGVVATFEVIEHRVDDSYVPNDIPNEVDPLDAVEYGVPLSKSTS